jgi:pimeloyl-ACP methyl ester carboxylesterase
MLVAGADEIIPNSSSNRLVEAWGGDATAVTIAGAGHNDIHMISDYWEAIGAFLKSSIR